MLLESYHTRVNTSDRIAAVLTLPHSLFLCDPGHTMAAVSTHIETILESLEQQDGGICDACLVRMTSITPHQAVNAACRRLFDQHRLSRDRGVCAGCGLIRIANRLTNQAPEIKRPKIGSTDFQDPTIGTAQWLDDVRRTMISHLNKVESTSPKGEPFSQRVSRMRDEGRLPGSFACLIQTVNGFRNLACYEQYNLNEAERQIVRLAYDEIQRWMKK